MMRSMAASTTSSSSFRSDKFGGLEFGDRLVGEANFVAFAVLEHLHDDFEQPFVGGESIGNGAGLAQIVGNNDVGIADHIHIHDPYPALDQHGFSPPIGLIKRDPGLEFPAESRFLPGLCFARFLHANRFPLRSKTLKKTKRTGPANRTDALGGSIFIIWLPVFLKRRLGRSCGRKSLRDDTGSGRSRTARAGAATWSGARIPRSRSRRTFP